MTVTLKRTLLIVVATLLGLLGCCYGKTENKGQARSLVTAKGTICPVTHFSDLLNEMLQDINADDQCDNLILFIHGRGNHPGKAFRQNLLTDLESDYSAKVIMFHWPSWDGPLGFPEKSARDAAEDFTRILRTLKAFKERHADLIQDTKFTLLTQSMGSLILEESARRRQNEMLGPLFDTLVICAAASYTQDHATWLAPLDLTEHLYIVMNRHDPVLGSAGLRGRGRRLGKGLKSRNKLVKLADNAVYIDATKLSLFHRYYLHRYLKRSPALKHFFDHVLNGLPATLPPGKQIVRIHEQSIP